MEGKLQCRREEWETVGWFFPFLALQLFCGAIYGMAALRDSFTALGYGDGFLLVAVGATSVGLYVSFEIGVLLDRIGPVLVLALSSCAFLVGWGIVALVPSVVKDEGWQMVLGAFGMFIVGRGGVSGFLSSLSALPQLNEAYQGRVSGAILASFSLGGLVLAIFSSTLPPPTPIILIAVGGTLCGAIGAWLLWKQEDRGGEEREREGRGGCGCGEWECRELGVVWVDVVLLWVVVMVVVGVVIMVVGTLGEGGDGSDEELFVSVGVFSAANTLTRVLLGVFQDSYSPYSKETTAHLLLITSSILTLLTATLLLSTPSTPIPRALVAGFAEASAFSSFPALLRIFTPATFSTSFSIVNAAVGVGAAIFLAIASPSPSIHCNASCALQRASITAIPTTCIAILIAAFLAKRRHELNKTSQSMRQVERETRALVASGEEDDDDIPWGEEGDGERGSTNQLTPLSATKTEQAFTSLELE